MLHRSKEILGFRANFHIYQLTSNIRSSHMTSTQMIVIIIIITIIIKSFILLKEKVTLA